MRKHGEALPKFSGGTDLSRKQREHVFPQVELLSVSFIFVSFADFDGDDVFYHDVR